MGVRDSFLEYAYHMESTVQRAWTALSLACSFYLYRQYPDRVPRHLINPQHYAQLYVSFNDKQHRHCVIHQN